MCKTGEWCQEDASKSCWYCFLSKLVYTQPQASGGTCKKGTPASTRFHSRIQKWGPDASPTTQGVGAHHILGTAPSTFHKQRLHSSQQFCLEDTVILPSQVRNSGLERLRNVITSPHSSQVADVSLVFRSVWPQSSASWPLHWVPSLSWGSCWKYPWKRKSGQDVPAPAKASTEKREPWANSPARPSWPWALLILV